MNLRKTTWGIANPGVKIVTGGAVSPGADERGRLTRSLEDNFRI